MLFKNGNYLQIDASRCLNQLHQGVECRHCVNHCPGEALVLSKHDIYLIQDKCLGCGLCFSDCPTQVFTSKQWDETTIVATLKEQKARETQFFCGRHSTPYLAKEERDKAAIQIPTCLSSVSKGAWYEIGLLTEVELRLDECEECPMKGSLARLCLAVNTALEWLNASGHPAEFSYIEIAEKAKRKKKLQAASCGLKITSRRDLFLSLLGRGNDSNTPDGSERRISILELRKKHKLNVLPDWQKRFAESYQNHFQQGGSPAYWPSIKVKTDCVNCGMCARYCPTQALQIKVEGNECTHSFVSGYCLDCRICMLACPTQSIIRERQVDQEPFEVKDIYKVPVTECKRCATHTLVNEGNLCYWCAKEPNQQDLLSDIRQKLFG